METSLHRALKQLYAGDAAQVEVRVGRYRVDAVAGDELVEIQHGPLGAIAPKIRELLTAHRVRIVKPIILNKLLVRRKRAGGKIASRRRSPKRGRLLDLFNDLVYFTRVFPHPGLTIEALLVDVEEYRRPGHGRRRRRRDGDFVVEDQCLAGVGESFELRTAQDLIGLIDQGLSRRFTTAALAAELREQRYFAQRIAYCLREMGAAHVVGKERNALVYELLAGDVPAARVA